MVIFHFTNNEEFTPNLLGKVFSLTETSKLIDLLRDQLLKKVVTLIKSWVGLLQNLARYAIGRIHVIEVC